MRRVGIPPHGDGQRLRWVRPDAQGAPGSRIRTVGADHHPCSQVTVDDHHRLVHAAAGYDGSRASA